MVAQVPVSSKSRFEGQFSRMLWKSSRYSVVGASIRRPKPLRGERSGTWSVVQQTTPFTSTRSPSGGRSNPWIGWPGFVSYSVRRNRPSCERFLT